MTTNFFLHETACYIGLFILTSSTETSCSDKINKKININIYVYLIKLNLNVFIIHHKSFEKCR